MKKYKNKIFYIMCVILIFSFPMTSFAHSGRTDSSGGHHDYKNKSGLGSYHYHHGYPAHLHPNGVCPYSSSSQTNTTYTSPSISIKEYPKTMYVGDSKGFKYSISNATSDETTITSSDSNIVTVNSDDTLTAVGAGTAKITISTSGASKSFTVEVKIIPVEKIKVVDKINKLQLGESYKLRATVLPENATNKDISWSSNNEDVLKISKRGTVKAKSSGVAVITCKAANDVKRKIKIEVYEVFPERIYCEDSIRLIVGDTYEPKISILPKNTNNKEFEMSCEDNELIELSDSSLHAISEGETVLHIETWNGIKKDIPVKIGIIPVERIEIKDSTKYMYSNVIDKSEEILLSPEISPSNATYKDVAWSSSNDGVITVNDNTFSINSTGKVTLTCTTHGEIAKSVDIFVVDKDLITILVLIAGVTVVTVVLFVVKKGLIKR